MIEKEDFDAWLDHPVTSHVFKQFAKVSERAKDAWVQSSWEHGASDPVLLADLRARAEVVNDLITVSYEDINDGNELEDKAKE